MGGLSLWHWLVVLVVVVLVFGTKRLRNVGQDLGEAVRGFRKGMHEGDAPGGDTPADDRPADGRLANGKPPGGQADRAPGATDATRPPVDRDPRQP